MMVTRYRRLALLTLLGFIAPSLYAETPASEQLDVEAITKKWKCKYCPDLAEKPWEVKLNVGLGYTSNDSYKFGEYNGLAEEGVFLIGDFDARYRDDEANYWDIKGNDLGLDSRHFKLEGGRQGTYKLNFEVDQITKNNLDSSRSPYGSSGAILTLPAGWVNAGTTAGFTTLSTDLHNVDFSTERRNLTLGSEYIASANTSYEVWFKRQTKEGNQPTGFGFGFNRAAILSKPIDYTTDQLELMANYHYAEFSGRVALIHSSFKNTIDAFRWDNAYDTPATATQGQAGTAPDNSSQQILLTGNYLGIKDMQLTGLVSYAQMKQDEAFLPYTVNSALAPPSLPQTSLNGKVQIFNTNLAAHWQYSPEQRWHFIYEHHEQDNLTARNTYTYVTADNAVTGTPRANFPYAFRTQKLKVNTDYKFDDQIKLSGGGQVSLLDRDYQSAERTEETSLWAKLKQRIDNSLQYGIKAELIDRSIDNYNAVSELTPAENPLMRKYNMADRNGQKIDFNLSYAVSSNVLLTFSSDIAQYDYDASSVGLTASDEISIGFDIQYTVSEDLGLSAFIQNTDIQSKQAGSQAFSTADWFATNDDKVLTVGLSANYQVIKDKLKVGLDYVHADSSASVDISGGTPFPDLTTQRDTIIVHADYIVDEKLTVKASYQYEDYSADNWYIDSVTPSTLSNVLTLGETTPDYSIGVFWLSLHYNF